MASTYRTKSGDTWDKIAYEEMGSGYYMDKLIAANQSQCEVFIFPAGVELTIPDVEEETVSTNPPWFRS